MKVLCDTHISYRVVNFFKSQGLEALHVNELPGKWHTKDSEICRIADVNDFVVISKDVDFKNSFLIKKSPKKLIKINLGNLSTETLIEVLKSHLVSLKTLFSVGSACVEVNRNGMVIVNSLN